ncbi:hypothetical protein JCM14076_05820 [Methylosoma difficile]
MERELNLGTLTFVIFHENHNRKLTASEKIKAVEDFISALDRLIESRNFDFNMFFEVNSIQDGCIKVKLSLKIAAVAFVSALAFVERYPGLREGALAIFEDGEKIISYFKSGSKPCRISLHTEKLTKSVYGPVSSGETLSSIVENWDYPGKTNRQIMYATVIANPQAFERGDMNILKKDAILTCPTDVHFKGVKNR